jgi:hypothetical protein
MPIFLRFLLTLSSSLLVSCGQDQWASAPGSGGTGYDQARQGRITVIAPIDALTRSSIDAGQQTWALTTQSQALLGTPPVVGETVWLNTADKTNNIAQYAASAALVGAIEDYVADLNNILIYGVNIRWDQHTVWQDGLVADRLHIGEHIAVDGSMRTDGVLIARRIRRAVEPQQRMVVIKPDGYDTSEQVVFSGVTAFLLTPQTEWQSGLTPEQLQTHPCVRIVLAPRGRSTLWPIQQISRWHQVLVGDFLGQDLLIPTKTAGEYQLGCQHIYTNSKTVWQGISPNHLGQPTRVQLYGKADSTGKIQALRIQKMP